MEAYTTNLENPEGVKKALTTMVKFMKTNIFPKITAFKDSLSEEEDNQDNIRSFVKGQKAILTAYAAKANFFGLITGTNSDDDDYDYLKKLFLERFDQEVETIFQSDLEPSVHAQYPVCHDNPVEEISNVHEDAGVDPRELTEIFED
jgi:hypothetical protein